jgi:hypothetical protein
MKKATGWRLDEELIKQTKKCALARDLPIEEYIAIAIKIENEKTGITNPESKIEKF